MRCSNCLIWWRRRHYRAVLAIFLAACVYDKRVTDVSAILRVRLEDDTEWCCHRRILANIMYHNILGIRVVSDEDSDLRSVHSFERHWLPENGIYLPTALWHNPQLVDSTIRDRAFINNDDRIST